MEVQNMSQYKAQKSYESEEEIGVHEKTVSSLSNESNDSLEDFPTLEELNAKDMNNNDLPPSDLNNTELHQYFMQLAIMYSKKRKNVKNQAAACIVDSNNKIVGIGNYKSHKSNFFTSLFKDSAKESNKDYLGHAEVNAIANKTESSLENCRMYVTSFPCIECAKLIAQSGLRNIIYIDDHCCQVLNEDQIMAAKMLFKLSNVICIKLE